MVAWVVHENDHRDRSIMLSPLPQLSWGGGDEAAVDAMQTPSYAPCGMQVAIMLLLLLLLNVACRC